ncbi:MAG: class I SAM-dependent methyltransferase [Alphaproteobacteria bacterium]|nr:class I SAM-dependent methyltransferase [Alphaproteobacteria bacterium]
MTSNQKTFLLDITRVDLLNYLDHGKVFAEIGVAEGVFSQDIVERCQPAILVLVDPWMHQITAAYAPDENNVSDHEQDRRFRSVSAMFEGQSVEILRETSLEAAMRFSDAAFDYIYIDAMHGFDAVSADLKAWWPKLKPDGLLMGHDYANHQDAQKMGFDVIGAVNAFVGETNCAFVGITNELYPSYILQKSWQAKGAEILKQAPILCSFELGLLSWDLLSFSDGTFKSFPRFGL